MANNDCEAFDVVELTNFQASETECPICQEDFRKPILLSCGHTFCYKCIGAWLGIKPECPLCKADANPDAGYKSNYLIMFAVNKKNNNLSRILTQEEKAELKPLLEALRGSQSDTKQLMLETAGELKVISRNVDIAQTVGNAVAVAGGVTAGVGLALTIATLGAGAPVAIIGGVVATLGGLTSAGAGITKIVKEKFSHSKIKEILEGNQEAFNNKIEEIISRHSEKLLLEWRKLQVDELRAFNDAAPTISNSIRFLIGGTETIVKVILTARFGVEGAKAAIRGLHIAGSAVSAALLLFDIPLLIASSYSLHKGSKSKAAECIEDIVENTYMYNTDDDIDGVIEDLDGLIATIHNEIDSGDVNLLVKLHVKSGINPIAEGNDCK